MALMIVAETPEDFAAWKHGQLVDAAPPETGETLRGAQIFQTHCAVCHTIRGVSPAGVVGPDLSHLMTRHTLAAGLLPNTSGNLAGWIGNSQTLKPGSRMPDQILSGPELLAVTTYLNTLH
jgi:cytochrome c oxidase subunit 2